jgi:hypothetical protein
VDDGWRPTDRRGSGPAKVEASQVLRAKPSGVAQPCLVGKPVDVAIPRADSATPQLSEGVVDSRLELTGPPRRHVGRFVIVDHESRVPSHHRPQVLRISL